jgi:hypothetical protein
MARHRLTGYDNGEYEGREQGKRCKQEKQKCTQSFGMEI